MPPERPSPQALPRGRLAPSPTGALHLGNARSFLLAWLSLRARGGSVILRIEDLDHPKVKPWATTQAIEDLRWLGLDWDEGPDVGGRLGPYVQRERTAFYRPALETLRDEGLIYPCICSRREVASLAAAPHRGEEGPRYPGTCRDRFATYAEARQALSGDRLPVWRFRVQPGERSFTDRLHGLQREDVWRTVGDFPIARGEDAAGYMLAVVVDDAAMGVTEVVRGDDLLPATHRQRLLQQALHHPAPRYWHVPLVVAEDGRRLAKRHGDTRLAALREAGVEPERVAGLLAWWSGLAATDAPVHPRELIPRFGWVRVPRHPVVLTDAIRRRYGVTVA